MYTIYLHGPYGQAPNHPVFRKVHEAERADAKQRAEYVERRLRSVKGV